MLKTIFRQLRVYQHVLAHPLNGGRAVEATRRWLGWHVGSRLVHGAVVVPFVNETLLLVTPGMTGATQNVYCGLADFAEMGFVLHALRPDELFLDVGANVGVYSILASGAVGARTIAIEALPETFAKLRQNVAINEMDARVECINVAVSDHAGTIRFTSGHDAMNHVAVAGEEDNTCLVSVRPLDELLAGRRPAIMKIDVEGYELPALKGARDLLSHDGLQAIVIEFLGQSSRYGFAEADVAQLLTAAGFQPTTYDPFSRTLLAQDGGAEHGNNLIYVRDIARMTRVLRDAPAYRTNTGHML